MKHVNFSLIILVFFLCFLCLALYFRGERIKEIANYDINKEHFIMRESVNYDYCPYCGENIAEWDNRRGSVDYNWFPHEPID